MYVCVCVCWPCKIICKFVELWHLAADICNPFPLSPYLSLPPKYKCDLLANGKSSLTA